MADLSSKRISMSNFQAALASGQVAVEVADRMVGVAATLRKGDEVTFGEVFLTSLKATLADCMETDETGKVTLKGAYWVSESRLKSADGVVLEGWEFPAGTFDRFRGAASQPTLAEAVSGKRVIRSSELFEQGLNGLTAAQAAFNREFYRAGTATEKLSAYVGRTVRVIKVTEGWVRRFNSKREENWGSKPEHWRRATFLYFEEVPAAAPAASDKPKTTKGSTKKTSK